MVLKLSGAASALLTLVMITAVGVGADEKKEERKSAAGARPDYFGTITTVSDDQKTFSITRKSKKGEEKKDFTVDEKTELIVQSEDKKLKAGLIGAVWLKEGSESVAAKVKAFEKKQKKTE